MYSLWLTSCFHQPQPFYALSYIITISDLSVLFLVLILDNHYFFVNDYFATSIPFSNISVGNSKPIFSAIFEL